MAINKIQEGDGLFVSGMNSSMEESFLQPSSYSRAMNMVNRGGILQCRPGYRCLMSLPEGRLQGFFVFRPKVGSPVLVFAVAGLIYTSQHPFKTFSQMEDVQFSDSARQIYFAQAEKSVQRNEDGSLQFIESRNVLVMQDGGFTSAAMFDGNSGSHQRGSTAIPLGGPMAFSGNRLWVARDSRVFASDLADPISFSETLYITGAPYFIFKSDVTALVPMPGSALPQLLVFTADTTSILQSGIRDRKQWAFVTDFQREVLPSIGAVSSRSVVSHMGYLWWFSRYGLVSFDSAAQAFVSSSMPYLDEQMADSKAFLSEDLNGVAACTFENYLLLSVPYASPFNRHTWVLDNSSITSVEKIAPSWNSFWTGTRPVEWFSGRLLGKDRVLYVSADVDGMNRLWEAFTPDRLDDGCPITWWAEMRAFASGSPSKFKEFRYADIFLTEISGDVDIASFWAGGRRGKFKRVLTKRIRAARGILRTGVNITMNDRIYALKKQSRYLRTQDARALATTETLSSCHIECDYAEFKDDSFQLLVVGSGPAAIRSIILYLDSPDHLDDSGKCEEDETEENFVRFDGAASEGSTVEDAKADFETHPDTQPEQFFANRTETVTAEGFTEVGIGEHTSVISMQDAEKVASAVAQKKAARSLVAILPLRVSRGGA